ncbi:MAG: class I SAM-dependent methyltransferase [Longimicrobiales bacterium]
MPAVGVEPHVHPTHDQEVARLALQHQVWRPRALDAWRRADFGEGQTILDVGCGPGYAALDLSEIVGPMGCVVAIDACQHFLDMLEEQCFQRGIQNIAPLRLDLDNACLPVQADGAWCRWVFGFLQRPRQLLEQISDVLKPGAVLVLHEYFDYSTWRVAPRSTQLEEFGRLVVEDWRATGGDPDIGLQLAEWLPDLEFSIASVHPVIEVVPRTSYLWEWQHSFLHAGLHRLGEAGVVTREQSTCVLRALAAAEAAPNALMVTPAVLEVIAVRR